MVAITAEPNGHSFASTRLYDITSGAQVTISFAISVADGLLTVEGAKRIRESIANLLTVGFSANAPGMEEIAPGEVVEEMAWFSRRRQINNDGRPDTPMIDIYLNNPTWYSRYTGIYLNTPEEIEEFENATWLKLNDMPLYDDDKPAKREDVRTGQYVIASKSPVNIVVKDNPKWQGENDKKNKKRLFVRWANVVAAPTPQPTPPSAPAPPVLVPKADAAPKAPAASQTTLPIGDGSDHAASDKNGWISPATWVKTRAEWDAYLASALARFHMDSDAVDNAHRRLSLCDKVGIGDWHKQRGWALAALTAAYCKYNADLIGAYTAGLPAIDSVANLQLDRMAKLLVEACPADGETDDDPFTKEFGGDDPAGRKAIAAELKNEMVLITRIEKDLTKRGHDLWIAFAPMDDSSEPLRITLYPEDVNSIKAAGYILAWPKTSGQSVAVNIAVTTYQNPASGRRIESVLAPTMGLDEAAGE